ncbi:MAG TPA: hypothetical protein VI732_01310 [Alphaproteobacteria bacterium]|nr:hypothetical protein [Alphaproteobacteria bacterium]
MRRNCRWVWAPVLAMLAAAATRPAGAVELVYKKERGAVQSSCVREEKTNGLICVVVYAKPPYLGFQFGSEDDPDSIAVTAGARRVPNSEITVKVDKFASHHVFGDGFVGKEAEALLYEIEQGTNMSVRFESRDPDTPSRGVIDLKDLRTALQEVERLRAGHSGE